MRTLEKILAGIVIAATLALFVFGDIVGWVVARSIWLVIIFLCINGALIIDITTNHGSNTKDLLLTLFYLLIGMVILAACLHIPIIFWVLVILAFVGRPRL